MGAADGDMRERHGKLIGPDRHGHGVPVHEGTPNPMWHQDHPKFEHCRLHNSEASGTHGTLWSGQVQHTELAPHCRGLETQAWQERAHTPLHGVAQYGQASRKVWGYPAQHLLTQCIPQPAFYAAPQRGGTYPPAARPRHQCQGPSPDTPGGNPPTQSLLVHREYIHGGDSGHWRWVCYKGDGQLPCVKAKQTVWSISTLRATQLEPCTNCQVPGLPWEGGRKQAM